MRYKCVNLSNNKTNKQSQTSKEGNFDPLID